MRCVCYSSPVFGDAVMRLVDNLVVDRLCVQQSLEILRMPGLIPLYSGSFFRNTAEVTWKLAGWLGQTRTKVIPLSILGLLVSRRTNGASATIFCIPQIFRSQSMTESRHTLLSLASEQLDSALNPSTWPLTYSHNVPKPRIGY